MCEMSPLEKVPTSILDKFNQAAVVQTPQYEADGGPLTKNQLNQIRKSAVQSMTGNIKFIDQGGGGQYE